jgi:hypothetical protein
MLSMQASGIPRLTHAPWQLSTVADGVDDGFPLSRE